MSDALKIAEWCWPDADDYEQLTTHVQVKWFDREKGVVRDVLYFRPAQSLDNCALFEAVIRERDLEYTYEMALAVALSGDHEIIPDLTLWNHWSFATADAPTRTRAMLALIEQENTK